MLKIIMTRNGEKYIVNYVWINSRPDQPGRAEECSVSLKHLDRAYENARSYPSAQFNVWVDYNFLDERSRKRLEAHNNQCAPPNVELRDLNDIPAYREAKIFKPGVARNIWMRVDLARVIVLDHVLESGEARYALYADFDTPDVRLNEARLRMDKYGVALGTTGANKENEGGAVENGYFGFQRKKDGPKFVRGLLASTFRAAACDKMNGYSAFRQLSGEWASARKTGWQEMTVHKVLYSMGYTIPDVDCYRAWKWN